MAKYIFKMVAIGNGGVGKTSIAMRYVKNKFHPNYKSTIGVSFAVKEIATEDYEAIINIWDTGGQEMFDYIRPLYYLGAHGAIIVYDVTDKRSFVQLDRWFSSLYETCGKIPIILVGNKIDLADSRVISNEEGEQFALKKGVKYYETSAKTGENVTNLMLKLTDLMIENSSSK